MSIGVPICGSARLPPDATTRSKQGKRAWRIQCEHGRSFASLQEGLADRSTGGAFVRCSWRKRIRQSPSADRRTQ